MNLLAAESLDGRQMPRRYPTVLMLLVGLIVCAADAYAASKTRQPKMPTEQQFLQRQLHTLRPQRETSSMPVYIEGRTLDHDAKTDTYTITGAARLEQGPTTITADQIVVQQRYRGVATGHVHIVDPTSEHTLHPGLVRPAQRDRQAGRCPYSCSQRQLLLDRKRHTQTSRPALPGYRCFDYNLHR